MTLLRDGVYTVLPYTAETLRCVNRRIPPSETLGKPLFLASSKVKAFLTEAFFIKGFIPRSGEVISTSSVNATSTITFKVEITLLIFFLFVLLKQLANNQKKWYILFREFFKDVYHE